MATEYEEDLARLDYAPQWMECGFLDANALQAQLHEWETGDDPNREHYRYASFCRVLADRTDLTDAEIACYLDLVARDADKAMAGAALGNLADWPRLSSVQVEYLRRHPQFDVPVLQKLFAIRDLSEALSAPTCDADTFANLVTIRNAHVQRAFIERDRLTDEQLATLTQDGASRAVRNVAAEKLRKRKQPRRP